MEIFLQVGDLTGFSFILGMLALLAATIFLVLERDTVSTKWKLSLSVGTLITGIAALHYHYLGHLWLANSTLPVELRYIELLLTVPLMAIMFFLILKAIGHASTVVLYRLLGFSLGMVLFGYLGEIALLDPSLAFGIGVVFWLLIILEIFKGEAAKIMMRTSHAMLKHTFGLLRLFVLIGWIIYPFGHYLGLHASGDLSMVFNYIDIINKVGFSLAIYLLARSDSSVS